jgi:hypothetical protein
LVENPFPVAGSTVTVTALVAGFLVVKSYETDPQFTSPETTHVKV